MRSALIEAETREEVMREMEDRMRIMEEKYSHRLMSEVNPLQCARCYTAELFLTAGAK